MSFVKINLLIRRMKSMAMSLPVMLTCRELDEFIVDYLDGRLSRRQRALFDMHIRLCSACSRYLQAYQCSIRLGQKVFEQPDEPVPAAVPEDLVKAILNARKSG
jgi:anti-sigma factor RsiW